MSTRNLGLETWPAGAESPDVPVNDSLQTIDALMRPGGIVEAITSTPPTTVTGDIGKTWIVGDAATGDWSGHDGEIALCTAAGLWRFYTPAEGWEVYNRTTGLTYVYTTKWEESASSATARNTVSALSSASGVLDIDYALGDYFTVNLTENITSITFSNLPGAGKGASLVIKFVQDSTARTVTWPASFDWAGGTTGSVSTGSGAIDVLAISTFDNGSSWITTLAKAFA